MEPIQSGHQPNETVDIETREWLESLDFVIENGGPERVLHLLQHLQIRAEEAGIKLPFSANTPYINTIHVEHQPVYPGKREIERRIKSLIRWNAMAMVVRANRLESGIGGTSRRLRRRRPCMRWGLITSFTARIRRGGAATRSFFRVTRRRGCMRGRFWKGG